MEMKYIESAPRVLDKNCVGKGGLDLSKEVLWISVDQRKAKLRAVKVGGQRNILTSFQKYLCSKWSNIFLSECRYIK